MILNSITMKYISYFPGVCAQILFIYKDEQIGSQNQVFTDMFTEHATCHGSVICMSEPICYL